MSSLNWKRQAGHSSPSTVMRKVLSAESSLSWARASSRRGSGMRCSGSSCMGQPVTRARRLEDVHHFQQRLLEAVDGVRPAILHVVEEPIAQRLALVLRVLLHAV